MMIEEKKFDDGKTRWGLLPWREVEVVVGVLMHGSKKYGDDNWKKVYAGGAGRERYFNATMRHILAWARGEITDGESGKSHLAHAICCLLFLLWGDINGHINYSMKGDDKDVR